MDPTERNGAHDQLCNEKCITVDHRSYQGINYLLSVKMNDTDDKEPLPVCIPEDKHFITAHLHGEIDVNGKDDKKSCDIRGVCLLNDGSLVISDYNNRVVKRLDKTFEVVDQCKLYNRPWGACSVGSTEVAVVLSGIRTIQFVSTENKMQCTNSFYVGMTCYFVAFSNGELFVTCGKSDGPAQVRVYNLSGRHLRTFQNNALGQPIFSDPYCIAVSKNAACLHVADRDKGLITTDRQGQHHWTFTGQQLDGAWGVIVDNSDALFVSGFNSNNVIEIHDQARETRELLSKADRIRGPQALCYDNNNDSLIVAMYETDFMKVFKLGGK